MHMSRKLEIPVSFGLALFELEIILYYYLYIGSELCPNNGWETIDSHVVVPGLKELST